MVTYEDACKTLDLDPDGKWTSDDIKRQYRRLALIHHPDKNIGDEEAAQMFRSVREAYDYLEEDSTCEDIDTDTNSIQTAVNNYKEILSQFLEPILNSPLFQHRIFNRILDGILLKCEERVMAIMEKMDRIHAIKILELLRGYKDVLHIGDDFLRRLDEMICGKVQDDSRVILNPFLEDLFDDNLYRLTDMGGVFLIPLWHHELVYDNSGGDLYVECRPILPENVEIDCDNNIHVSLRYSLDEIWKMSEILVKLGSEKSAKIVEISRGELFLKPRQTVIFKGMGISKINTQNIYDNTNRGDILVHVEIFRDQ